MAYAVEVMIGTSRKVSVNYQSHEVQIGVTFRLERGDNDLLAIIEEKTAEVGQAYQLASRHLRNASAAFESAAPEPEECATKRVSGKSPMSKRAISNDQTAEGSNRPEFPLESPPEAQADLLGQPPDLSRHALESPLTAAQHKTIQALQNRTGLSDQDLQQFLEMGFNRHKVEQLTKNEAARLILQLSHRERERMERERMERQRKPPGDAALNGTQFPSANPP